MTVGEEIRRKREDKGWSQAKLGVLSGAGPSGISQIETGRRNPSAGTLQRIADALEVEVRDLFPLGQVPLLDLEEEEWRHYYESRTWNRINLLQRTADLWQKFIGEGLYDLKGMDLENLKAIDTVSLHVILDHGRDARSMKRLCTAEQREHLERAERHLVDANLEFWARVENELARREDPDFEAHRARFKSRRKEWEQASRNSMPA
jgi:transcriptional regulator with XRE-family HTH domain